MEILLDKKTIFRILKNKKLLEERLGVSIRAVKGKIEIEGEADKEYVAERVISAIEANFPINVALLLIEEDYMMKKINIKDISRRKPEVVRARIIGTKGKTLEILCNLSDCFIELKDNDVFIIGNIEDIKAGVQAVSNLISGSKQGNVYKYLEKARGRKKGNLSLR